MPSLFVPDDDAAEELMKQPAFRQSVVRAVQSAVQAANQIAEGIRVMDENPVAIEVEEDSEGVRIVNTDHGWHIAEYGSVNNPPHAPLRRGLRDAGMRLQELDE